MPVGYQKVDGGDGEEEGEGGGEGEKGQELHVMNGNAGGAKEAVPKSKVDSKPRQSHTATKVYKALKHEIYLSLLLRFFSLVSSQRLLNAFTIQAFLFSVAVGILIMYGSH